MPRKFHKGRVRLPTQPPRLKAKYSNPAQQPPTFPKTPTFQTLPPMRQARDYAYRELSNQGNPQEIQWLYDHPLLWLRALHQLRSSAEHAIAQDNFALKALRTFPEPGNPPESYLQARRVHTQTIAKKHKFLFRLDLKIGDVSSLCGGMHILAEFEYVNVLVRLAQLIADDEVTNAQSLALHIAEKATTAHRKNATS